MNIPVGRVMPFGIS